MKPKFQKLYSNIAKEVARMSYARRLQVGAVVVKDDRVISMGYNGMPSGWENDCEYKNYMPDGFNPVDIEIHNLDELFPLEDEKGRYVYKTRPEVLHAESNAISKLARSSESGAGSDLFVTHSPCMECAKLIYQAGIQRVFYSENYRDDSGIKFLLQSGIKVIKNDE